MKNGRTSQFRAQPTRQQLLSVSFSTGSVLGQRKQRDPEMDVVALGPALVHHPDMLGVVNVWVVVFFFAAWSVTVWTGLLPCLGKQLRFKGRF